MVIISNGFSKFHLSVAAEELCRRGKLAMLLTGAYPTGRARQILDLWPLKRSSKAQRLLARGQTIDDSLVVHLWIPESLHAMGQIMKRRETLSDIAGFLDIISLRAYGRQAVEHVQRAAKKGARIYHCQAGFGHGSVQVAKAAGLVTIGHHSIAHPANVCHSGA